MERKKELLGNEKAKQVLKEYIVSESMQPLILYGPSGLGKRTLAEGMVAEWFNCKVENLIQHPDYYYYTGYVKVNDLEQLFEASKRKSLGKEKVFLFDQAELSDTVSNKLLKLMEDQTDTNHVIFISEQKLLETVESRCRIIQFHPLSDLEMKKFLLEEDQDLDWQWYSFLCQNCPGKFHDKKELYLKLYEFYEKLVGSKKEELLHLLHLVKEKDNENYYDQYKNSICELIRVFEFFYLQILHEKVGIETGKSKGLKGWEQSYTLGQICKILKRFVLSSKDIMFTKDEFFLCIQLMCE